MIIPSIVICLFLVTSMYYVWTHRDDVETIGKLFPITVVGSIVISLMLSESPIGILLESIDNNSALNGRIIRFLFHDYAESIVNYPLFGVILSLIWITFATLIMLSQKFQRSVLSKKDKALCSALKHRLQRIDAELNWIEYEDTDNRYIPIDAEVDEVKNGKKAKRYKSLVDSIKHLWKARNVFLVLGAPGSGKSVSMRRFCMDLLDDAKHLSVIPVYIDLKQWNKTWATGRAPEVEDLRDFIKTVLYNEVHDPAGAMKEYISTSFGEMLEAGKFYFIFDSFDEMPCFLGPENQSKMVDSRVRHISSLLYYFLMDKNQNGGIVASRTYRKPSYTLKANKKLVIQPLDDSQIRKMISAYLPDKKTAKGVETQLFGKREDLVSFCRNPFSLSLLLYYVRRHIMSALPTKHMDIFRDYLKGRLEQCAGTLEKYGINQKDVYEFAKGIAVDMQESKEYGMVLPAMLIPDHNCLNEKYIQILEMARICRSDCDTARIGMITFVHRRFQEFFLTEFMIEKNANLEPMNTEQSFFRIVH